MTDPNKILSENLNFILRKTDKTAKAFVRHAEDKGIDIDYSHFTRVLKIATKDEVYNVTLSKLNSFAKAVSCLHGFENTLPNDLLRSDFKEPQEDKPEQFYDAKSDFSSCISSFIIETGQAGWINVTNKDLTIELLCDLAWGKFKETETGKQLSNENDIKINKLF